SPPAARAWTANIKVSLNGVGCRTPVPVEQESKIRAPRHDGQGPLGDRHVGTPSTEGWNQHETARVNHTAGYADKCCAASRAIMSVLPPAPNGTTMVTGLEGQSAAAIERDNRAIAASPEKTTSSLSARAYQFPLPPPQAERGREPSELQEASRTSDHFARSANPGPYTNKIVVISSSGSCRSFAYTWEGLS